MIQPLHRYDDDNTEHLFDDVLSTMIVLGLRREQAGCVLAHVLHLPWLGAGLQLASW